MAVSKESLIKKGKELGLNLKSSMSMYELKHRIEDKEAEIAKEKESKKDTPKLARKARGGEY